MIIDSAPLTPYLVPAKHRFYLRLFSIRTNDGLPVTDNPFWVVSDAAPFSRVYSAALHSDADKPVLPLFLTVQSDAISNDNTISSLANNVLIEQQWQRLFAIYGPLLEKAALLILQEQVSRENTLLPFDPLFFCREKQAYFPPVCPRCGHALKLCRDDDMLHGHALQSYSTTLRRYLFCDSCIVAGLSPVFYVLSKMPGDPDIVIDRDGLISFMANPGGGANQDQPVFPCPGCPLRQACYGPEKAVLGRISVFSFYPFFMLVFDAARISARDRGRLTSGEFFTRPEDIATEKNDPGGSRPDIAVVLKRIMHRWQSEKRDSTSAEAPFRVKDPPPDARTSPTDIQETVIISKRTAFPDSSDPQAGNELQKTRILRPAPEQVDPQKYSSAALSGTLEKTRLITRPDTGLSSASSGQRELPEESSSQAAHHELKSPLESAKGENPVPGEKPANTDGDPAALEKTVIIPRGRTGKKE